MYTKLSKLRENDIFQFRKGVLKYTFIDNYNGFNYMSSNGTMYHAYEDLEVWVFNPQYYHKYS